jgi:hypothetical protein
MQRAGLLAQLGGNSLTRSSDRRWEGTARIEAPLIINLARLAELIYRLVEGVGIMTPESPMIPNRRIARWMMKAL